MRSVVQRPFVDTSVIVAALQHTHEHNRRAVREINERRERGEKLIIAAHSLAEAYAVLTRYPPPNRIGPSDAWQLLSSTFAQTGEIVSLDEAAYVALIQTAPSRAIIGGRIYDAVILECAVRAGADVLLTFNARHFIDLAPPLLQIVVPG